MKCEGGCLRIWKQTIAARSERKPVSITSKCSQIVPSTSQARVHPIDLPSVYRTRVFKGMAMYPRQKWCVCEHVFYNSIMTVPVTQPGCASHHSLALTVTAPPRSFTSAHLIQAFVLTCLSNAIICHTLWHARTIMFLAQITSDLDVRQRMLP